MKVLSCRIDLASFIVINLRDREDKSPMPDDCSLILITE